MSAILRNQYYRKMLMDGFFINENEDANKKVPPSNVMVMDIGNETYIKIKKFCNIIPPDIKDKHRPIKTTARRDKDIYNNKKQQDPKDLVKQKTKIKCPTIPFDWISNNNQPTLFMY